jgi:hypothetical protein
MTQLFVAKANTDTTKGPNQPNWNRQRPPGFVLGVTGVNDITVFDYPPEQFARAVTNELAHAVPFRLAAALA